MPFRSLRSSTVYLCPDCEHQWEGERTEPAPLDTPELGSDIADV